MHELALGAALAAMDGNVMTHNHPSGKTLRPEDIQLGIDHGLREVRATTPVLTYVMKLNTEGMENVDRYLLKQLQASTFSEQVSLLRQVPGIMEKSVVDRNHMIFENTWKALSEKRPDVFKYYTVKTK